MMDYLYDGTFEGILTCIYPHYYTDKASGIFPAESYQSCMLGGYMDVETDEEKAGRVYEAVKNKISYFDLARIYKVYLSNDPQKENKILDYVVFGFKKGPSVSKFHGSSVVAAVESIEKKIKVEQERMMQFVRFSVMERGVMYSEIAPDNDVLELVADHFSERFRNDPFIIHDTGRKKAVVAFEGKWYTTPFDGKDIPDESEDEKMYRRLWKHYFDNIAIKERTNRKCQSRFIPQRYRKNLTEMNTV